MSHHQNEGLLIAILIICIACGIAQPIHVRPTETDYRKALGQIEANITSDIAPSFHQLAIEDLRQPTPKHPIAWWASKEGLLSDTAEIASAVGHK